MIQIQQEQWLDIFDQQNYEISSYGKIRNKINQKILKQTLGNHGYYYVGLRKNDKQQNQLVHRLLALHFIPNPQLLKFVDHRDCNKTNNSLSNLRWVTRQQNSMNAKKHKNSQSQFKGVCFNQQNRKWKAQIMIDGKKTYLGYFDNEQEAGRAYDRKAIELFGEFAKTNFPREDYQEQQ